MTEEYNDIVNNPETRKKLKGAVDEAVDSLIREDSEKELRKDIASRIEDELGLKKATFNKLAKVVYKNSLEEEEQTLETLSTLHEAVAE